MEKVSYKKELQLLAIHVSPLLSLQLKTTSVATVKISICGNYFKIRGKGKKSNTSKQNLSS